MLGGKRREEILDNVISVGIHGNRNSHTNHMDDSHIVDKVGTEKWTKVESDNKIACGYLRTL